MIKSILTVLTLSALFSACSKKETAQELPSSQPTKQQPETCIPQTANPTGRSYQMNDVQNYNCGNKFCGLISISNRNYWIYLDSFFVDGSFSHVQVDTLRFSSSMRSLTDGLVWWKPSISIGLPELMYVNDSAFFKLEPRLFSQEQMDVRSEFAICAGDSARYFTSFEDAGATGRTVKMKDGISVNGIKYDNILYFDKNARSYRRDQVYIKPGVGVIRYVQERAPLGSPNVKLAQISTLLYCHFE